MRILSYTDSILIKSKKSSKRDNVYGIDHMRRMREGNQQQGQGLSSVWLTSKARGGLWDLFIDFFIWHNFSLLKLQRNDLKPIQYILGRKIY
jgi:hypothetical protein